VQSACRKRPNNGSESRKGLPYPSHLTAPMASCSGAFELPLAVFGFVFDDEIVMDLTLFFVGYLGKLLAEHSQILVMNESFHDRWSPYASVLISTEVDSSSTALIRAET
jgi:hypothetical protein